MRKTFIGMSSALVLIAAPAFAQTSTEAPGTVAPTTQAPLGEAHPESSAAMEESEDSVFGQDEPVVGVQPPPPVERTVECTGNEVDCPMGDQAEGSASGMGADDTGSGGGSAQ
ncbi:MAG TPA: hypothetical protein VK943_09250 [Arenibaculum sp.]|nr:hypothetical protein [Arenibaculum sp.]